MTSVVDLAELWSGQQTLPRHPDGDPDVDAAGRLLAALWLGGFDAFGAAITPLPSGAIHAALVPDALAVIVDGAPGATFVARLESRLGGFGATAALLAALGQWLEGAQEIVDGAATVVPRASGRHTAPANVRDTAAGSRLHADPASEQPADSGSARHTSPGSGKLSAPDGEGIPEQIAGFEILDLLGAGAMGRVFKARQTSLDRVVALKVLASSLAGDDEFVARLEGEAKAAARLSHPNVVGVIETGRCPTTGYAFIAFEYVAGKSVEDLLRSVGKLPEADALALCIAVAEALKCAEDHGIVHRDIKPANIVIGSDGIPRLLDLGLAKGKGEGSDDGVVFVGTPRYVAPEQGLGLDDIDHRADLYSLGICLFEFVTGRVPYEDTSAFALIMRHVEEDVPDPRSLEPSVSVHLAQLVAGLCARERDERYGTATEALKSMRRVLEGKPPVRPAGAGTGRIVEARGQESVTGIRSGPSGLGGRGTGRIQSQRHLDPDTGEPEEIARPKASSPRRKRSTQVLRAVDRQMQRFAADQALADQLGVPIPEGAFHTEYDEAQLLLSDDMARAYQIRRILGEGAQGRVFDVAIMGDQSFPGYERPVEQAVVKVAKERDALKQEQQLYSLVDRRVVRMLDSGTLQGGEPYVVLERLEEEPYDRFPDRNKRRVDPATAIDIFVNLLDSVRRLHFRRQRPIVLCDIKPANIMLRMPSVGGEIGDEEYVLRIAQGRYEPVFTDLGSAQYRELLDQSSGRLNELIGSPLYLPPESVPTLRGEEFTPGLYTVKTDVYALTLTLYCYLTGDKPYAWRGLYDLRGADFLCELLDFKRDGVPPYNRKLIHRVLGNDAPPVIQLIDAGLAANPDQRASVAALAKMAQRLFKVQPVEGVAEDEDYVFDKLDNTLRLRQGYFPTFDLMSCPYLVD